MAVPLRRVPPLDSWILEYLAAEWPGFGDLRSAASAPGQRDRLRNAVSILVNDVRVAMAGAFLTATRRPSPGAAGPLSAADTSRIDADVERARHMHNCARMLLSDDHAHSGRRARSGSAQGVGSGHLMHRPSPRRRRGMGPGL